MHKLEGLQGSPLKILLLLPSLHHLSEDSSPLEIPSMTDNHCHPTDNVATLLFWTGQCHEKSLPWVPVAPGNPCTQPSEAEQNLAQGGHNSQGTWLMASVPGRSRHE